MIYTKKANFPYPILTNKSYEYTDAEFNLDVELKSNAEAFIFDFIWEISSAFINKLLQQGKAKLIVVIKSRDNQFHYFDGTNTKLHLELPKSKLYLNTRTTIQMQVIAQENISFKDNNDLDEFFNDIKFDLVVTKGNVLGLSNVVTCDGSQNKPFDLFEKMVDPNIKGDLEIKLSSETIIVVYKDKSFQFSEMTASKELNYPYLYAGLQKALIRFISNYGNLDDEIQLDEIEGEQTALDEKLKRLMISKGIESISMDNIDEVIALVSDRLIGRYSAAVRGMRSDS